MSVYIRADSGSYVHIYILTIGFSFVYCNGHSRLLLLRRANTYMQITQGIFLSLSFLYGADLTRVHYTYVMALIMRSCGLLVYLFFLSVI